MVNGGRSRLRSTMKSKQKGKSTMSVKYELWESKEMDGKKWAVRLINGRVSGTYGPLYFKDVHSVTVEDLAAFEYTNDRDAEFEINCDRYWLW